MADRSNGGLVDHVVTVSRCTTFGAKEKKDVGTGNDPAPSDPLSLLANDTSVSPWSRTAFGGALRMEGQMSKWATVFSCGKSESLTHRSQPTDISHSLYWHW